LDGPRPAGRRPWHTGNLPAAAADHPVPAPRRLRFRAQLAAAARLAAGASAPRSGHSRVAAARGHRPPHQDPGPRHHGAVADANGGTWLRILDRGQPGAGACGSGTLYRLAARTAGRLSTSDRLVIDLQERLDLAIP